jgi:outer membrane protein assembly factor BamB
MTGHTLWSYYTGDELYVSPSYADGKIYVTTSQRDIFVLDTTSNGTKIATATTPSSSWSSPTIANDRLYIGCNDWNVYCFSSYVTNQASTPAPSHNVTLGYDLVIVVAVIATVVVVALFTVDYAARKKTKKSTTAVVS